MSRDVKRAEEAGKAPVSAPPPPPRRSYSDCEQNGGAKPSDLWEKDTTIGIVRSVIVRDVYNNGHKG